ncbi:MAG: type IV secretory system conjugative DNA transfer family protein [Oscillospiraceae bacterium]|nr:type IV secretory system conjugative DNA transfer family protein [Oscillospiraceae bacterium]
MTGEYGNRKNYEGTHYLAEGFSFDTDTWKSGTNNNVMVLGPTGAGKTRNYVKPNVAHSHESMIILDTKGSLYEELAGELERSGFNVKVLDFTNLRKSCGYNPLDYIRYDRDKGRYAEQDMITLCSCLIQSMSSKEPYWDFAARQYLECLIGYVMEALPVEEHTLGTVVKLLYYVGTDVFDKLMYEFCSERPDSMVCKRYSSMKTIRTADKMDASIKGILSTNLDPLCFDDALALYSREEKIDFRTFGTEKTALFLTVSDTDRSLDKLAGAFMTQALQQLCHCADTSPCHRLEIPVRLYLDDFANTIYIPDFDKIISVIRSREISVSIMLQSVTQLITLYGESCANTIINNCDKLLYLGGQDLTTAGMIAEKANRTKDSILSMDLEDAYLFVRGSRPQKARKICAA